VEPGHALQSVDWLNSLRKKRKAIHELFQPLAVTAVSDGVPARSSTRPLHCMRERLGKAQLLRYTSFAWEIFIGEA
jgi:hypothetical protein